MASSTIRLPSCPSLLLQAAVGLRWASPQPSPTGGSPQTGTHQPPPPWATLNLASLLANGFQASSVCRSSASRGAEECSGSARVGCPPERIPVLTWEIERVWSGIHRLRAHTETTRHRVCSPDSPRHHCQDVYVLS